VPPSATHDNPTPRTLDRHKVSESEVNATDGASTLCLYSLLDERPCVHESGLGREHRIVRHSVRNWPRTHARTATPSRTRVSPRRAPNHAKAQLPAGAVAHAATVSTRRRHNAWFGVRRQQQIESRGRGAAVRGAPRSRRRAHGSTAPPVTQKTKPSTARGNGVRKGTHSSTAWRGCARLFVQALAVRVSSDCCVGAPVGGDGVQRRCRGSVYVWWRASRCRTRVRHRRGLDLTCPSCCVRVDCCSHHESQQPRQDSGHAGVG
jgi:hypothetical protein